MSIEEMFAQDQSILEAWFGEPHSESECEDRYPLGVDGMDELISHKDGSFSYSEGGSDYPLPRLMIPLLAEYLLSSRLAWHEANFARLEKEAEAAEAERAAAEKSLRKSQERTKVRLNIVRQMIPSWNDGTGTDWDTPRAG